MRTWKVAHNSRLGQSRRAGMPSYVFLSFTVLLTSLMPAPASAIMESKLWEPVTWSFENPSYSANPYDVRTWATFTHVPTGQEIRTGLVHDHGDTWKLRFTGTLRGRWTFKTGSFAQPLSGLEGQVEVRPNPGVPGFMTNFGSKWGRLGVDEAFVPQYVMYRDPPEYYRNPEQINADIRTFFIEHGFNGFHTSVLCRWFDLDKTRSSEIDSPSPNPDPRTFEALELLIRKVHAAGGVVHIWAWGDEQRKMTPKKWGLNGEVDRRLQRYICARLGPLPGWSMGYGFDLQEWLVDRDLRTWHKYMHDHLGWLHFLGGRAPDLEQICDALDYSSYQQHRPDYDIYVRAIEQYPDKPTFLEDRFRVRKNVYPRKDYDFDMTRRGLWHSTMAGGAANIWGNLLDPHPFSMSNPYPNRNQILTWSRFWKERFRKELARDNSLTDGVCLKVPGRLLIFYKEDTNSIRMDLTELKGAIEAVAVDTRRDYKEIAISGLKAGHDQVFEAPVDSDWAVAVWTR
ncbi:MAG: DUF5060 domain-containing protein [Phycisphaerales bacterium]|nr:MAG: DUF5060 domain-containing protein [Phycisphaerales bacterium]